MVIPLFQLDQRVFAYICSFLAICDKFTGLILVNRSLNRDFDITEYCRSDSLVIMMTATDLESFDQTLAKCWQQFKLVDRMCNVLIHYQSTIPSSDEHRLVEAVNKLIENESLHTLVINENKIVEISQTHYTQQSKQSDLIIGREFLHALKSINQTNNQSINHLTKFVWSTCNIRMSSVDWSGLKLCNNLSSIDLDLIVADFNNQSINQFIKHIPNGLQHLRLMMHHRPSRRVFGYDSVYQSIDPEEENVEFDFDQLFASNEFLPHLKSLDLGTFRFTPQTLTNTIMSSTNLIRPITCLKLGMTQVESSIASLDHLNYLIALDIKTNHHELFGNLSESSMRQLSVFTLHQDNSDVDQMTDLVPLLTFVSRRPIQSLFLTFPHMRHADTCVKLLASMSSLRSLTLNGPGAAGPAFKVDQTIESLNPWLPEACWPDMTYLSGTFRPYEIASLLRASPTLRVADFGCWPDPSVFAMFGRFCPLIQSIKVDDNPPVAPEQEFDEDFWRSELDQLNSAFTRYEQPNNSFSDLLHLNMQNWCRDGCTARTLHYLLSKMTSAQEVVVFQLPKSDNGEGCNLMEYMALRSFPKVHEVIAENLDSMAMELFRSKIDRSSSKRQKTSDLEYRFVEPTWIPPVCWADPEIHNVSHVTSDPEAIERNLNRLNKPLEIRMVLANSHLGERGYLRFRRQLDESGLDGRAAFMIALYEALSDDDKELLKDMDAGHYICEEDE